MKILAHTIKSLFNSVAVSLMAILLISHTALADDSYSSFTYQVEGQGQDVVLIPGLMSDGRVWASTAKVLSEKHRVHTISIAGFGITPTKESNKLKKVEDELMKYILSLDQPTIIGHSIGGFLAMSLAIKEPDSISNVVSVDGLPFIGPVFTRNPNTKVSDISAQARFIKGHYSTLSKKQLTIDVARGVNIQATLPSTQKRIIEMSSLSDAKTVGNMIYSVMTTDLRPKLHKIKAKVLMLGASGALPNDESKDQVEHLYKRQFDALPSAEVVMNRNARHFIMLDDVEWLLRNVNKLLGE
jgi:pimeloyl-ACP methyl ester carboxylesterase